VGTVLWIARAIILLLILRWLLRVLFGGAGTMTRPTAGPADRPAERIGGELVRDPHCGTYVPKSRAIAVGTGSGTVYFCSTTCKDAFDKRS